MSNTMLGIVSYGGLRFLEITLRQIRDTWKNPGEVYVVVAKPDDWEMSDFLRERGIEHHMHSENKGFPASINDLYDEAFIFGKCDKLICMGNDVVPLEGSLDAMVNTADTTDYEMVCGSEFNSRFLYDHYPESHQFFDGPNLVVNEAGFTGKPWELHRDFHFGIEPDTLKDVRNMTLFKRSSFEKVGYDDVAFWPNGYFADNDYALRCNRAGVRACGLKEAAFFHWWSRTIHQGENRQHGKYFERNREYYVSKWGGMPNQETKEAPIKISDRSNEAAIIERWSKL